MSGPLYVSGMIYVDVDATGGNNGSSWADAFTTLQPALEVAGAGDQIWVASGTYTPTHVTTPGDPRSATFQLKDGVALYGGFDPSAGDDAWDERDWGANVTTLSGDIGTVGDPGDNSYHVFYHPAELALDGSAVLDGFTVSGGNSDADPPNSGGGGMHNSGSSPTVANCIFSANSAVNVGGGMHNYSSSPVVSHCTFSQNVAESGGGGMYNGNSSPTVTNCSFSHNEAGAGGGMYNEVSSSPVVDSCIFSGNSARSYYGGGMYNRGSSPTVTNCTFYGNTAGPGAGGGGMYNELSSSATVVNCVFSGNSAGYYGGGMFNAGSSPVVTNCTFSGNSAAHNGGAVVNHAGSSPAVTNCILWGDTPNEIADSDSTPDVSFSDVQGGYTGAGNINAAPLFVAPGSGDYHLDPDSPCIDVGTNAAPDLPGFDFEGDPRILDGDCDGIAVVDMGVDEVHRYHVALPLVLSRAAPSHERGDEFPVLANDAR